MPQKRLFFTRKKRYNERRMKAPGEPVNRGGRPRKKKRAGRPKKIVGGGVSCVENGSTVDLIPEFGSQLLNNEQVITSTSLAAQDASTVPPVAFDNLPYLPTPTVNLEELEVSETACLEGKPSDINLGGHFKAPPLPIQHENVYESEPKGVTHLKVLKNSQGCTSFLKVIRIDNVWPAGSEEPSLSRRRLDIVGDPLPLGPQSKVATVEENKRGFETRQPLREGNFRTVYLGSADPTTPPPVLRFAPAPAVPESLLPPATLALPMPVQSRDGTVEGSNRSNGARPPPPLRKGNLRTAHHGESGVRRPLPVLRFAPAARDSLPPPALPISVQSRNGTVEGGNHSHEARLRPPLQVGNLRMVHLDEGLVRVGSDAGSLPVLRLISAAPEVPSPVTCSLPLSVPAPQDIDPVSALSEQLKGCLPYPWRFRVDRDRAKAELMIPNPLRSVVQKAVNIACDGSDIKVQVHLETLPESHAVYRNDIMKPLVPLTPGTVKQFAEAVRGAVYAVLWFKICVGVDDPKCVDEWDQHRECTLDTNKFEEPEYEKTLRHNACSLLVSRRSKRCSRCNSYLDAMRAREQRRRLLPDGMFQPGTRYDIMSAAQLRLALKERVKITRSQDAKLSRLKDRINELLKSKGDEPLRDDFETSEPKES